MLREFLFLDFGTKVMGLISVRVLTCHLVFEVPCNGMTIEELVLGSSLSSDRGKYKAIFEEGVAPNQTIAVLNLVNLRLGPPSKCSL